MIFFLNTFLHPVSKKMTILFTRHQSLPTQFEELALGSSLCSMHLPSLFLRPMSRQQSFTLFLPEEASPDGTR